MLHARQWKSVETLERRVLLAIIPAGFTDTQLGGGIGAATAMAFLPDGAILAAQQTGELRVIRQATLLGTPFVDLTVDALGERGLLGVAVDPNFAANHFVYLYYTVPGSPPHNRVSRFTADFDNPNVAITGSEFVLMDLDDLGATNHNGGAIHFGPDGKLYIAVGENANPSNAQTLDNRLGKVLRINSDGSIPIDNPFYNTAIGDNRSIWALGLRNPFTFGFDSVSGVMHVNDVGAATWEEINVGVAGANYGWPLIEGPITTQTPPAGYVDPLFAYGHPGEGTDPNEVGAAVTGGAFYRPPVGGGGAFPAEYSGDYFFADLGSGWIRYLDAGTSNPTLFATGLNTPVDMQIGFDGSLYYLQRGSPSGVHRVRFTDTGAPSVSTREFQFDAPVQQLRYVFSEYVGDTLTTADLLLENEDGPIASANIALDYSAATHTASFRFPGFGGVLPDGNYTATLNAPTISDNSNNPLSPDTPLEFFVLTADANHDRHVDSLDFGVVSMNFGKSGMSWDDGDFNYDGMVNALDFGALATKYGTFLEEALAAAAVARASGSPAADLFSDRTIDDSPSEQILASPSIGTT